MQLSKLNMKIFNRSLSVDIAKGVSIIAIVLGHVNFLYPTGQLVNTKDLFIYLWHVAVFFC